MNTLNEQKMNLIKDVKRYFGKEYSKRAANDIVESFNWIEETLKDSDEKTIIETWKIIEGLANNLLLDTVKRG